MRRTSCHFTTCTCIGSGAETFGCGLLCHLACLIAVAHALMDFVPSAGSWSQALAELLTCDDHVYGYHDPGLQTVLESVSAVYQHTFFN